MTRDTRPDERRGAIGPEAGIDLTQVPDARRSPSNVVGELETDSEETDDDFDDMPTTPPAMRDLEQELNRPTSQSVGTNTSATAVTRQSHVILNGRSTVRVWRRIHRIM